MNAAQFSQIVLAPWRQRDRDAPWGLRMIAALLATGAVAAVVFLPPAAKWRAVLGLGLLALLGMWMALAVNLQEQNHPTAAHCVPGHARTLRRAAMLSWGGCIALASLTLWLIMPGSQFWAVIVLGSSIVATFLLWSTRLWWLWLLLSFSWPLLQPVAARLAPLGQALVGLWQAHTVGMLLLGLLAQALIVAKAFENGGAAHQARYARMALMRTAMRMQSQGGPPPAFSTWSRHAEWLFSPFERVLAAWQRRLVENADNGDPRSVMARAAVVLHGPQHWLKQAMGIATLLGLALVAVASAWLIYGVDLASLLSAGAFGMGIGIASVGLSPSLALPIALWHSRREQALLRLLPGVPQGEALNRAVGRLQLRHFLVAWLLCELALAGLAALSGETGMLYLPLASLPFGVLALTRRPAFMRPATPMTALVPTLAGMLLWGGLLLLVRSLGVPPGLVIATVVGASALLLAWRWRRMVAAPMALPAGRLG